MGLYYLTLVTIISIGFLIHKSASMHTRVVDGSLIDITDVPFMLSLRFNGAHVCGAAIISENWALTAAHCVVVRYGNVSDYYSVRSGSSFRDSGGEINAITSIISHELYDELNSDYDIAVLKVERPFEFDETTEPIDLPGDDYVDDTWGIIAGWGYYKARREELSEALRFAEVPKVDRNTCVEDYRGLFAVTPEQVCYGYAEGGMDGCKGDSGGPLFTNESIVIGITSWGGECGAPRSPGVYTTIFLMLDWIYDKTGVKSQL